MNISVELSNLGPLRSAEIELADLILLTGENNTGKTFFATVLHRILGATPTRPGWRRSYTRRVPDEVQAWIRRALKDLSESPDANTEATDSIVPALFPNENLDASAETMNSSSPAFSPNDATLRWAEEFTQQILQDYGEAVRDSIAYAYGAEASLLRRRTPSRHASNCYLRVRNSATLEWEVEIRFDSDEVFVKPPDPMKWLALLLSPELLHEVNLSRPDFQLSHFSVQRLIDNLSFYPHSRMFYPGKHTFNNPVDLFSSWPQKAIHLPADRTGIMQSHNVLAGAAVRQSARAGIRPIEIETLPGTSADFLSLILEIPGIVQRRRRGRSSFSLAVRKFEKSMRAEIEVDQRSDGLDAIMAVTPEGRFPMARASSMLSELAPLLLVLKSFSRYPDHLTIDEPEAHLHPEMQIRLASFLAELVNSGMGIVLTTHSDFFIAQINNMMRLHELSTLSDDSNSRDLSVLNSLPALNREQVRSLRFSREDKNGWCVARESQADVVDGGVDESTFTEVMRSQYDETARLVNELLETAE